MSVNTLAISFSHELTGYDARAIQRSNVSKMTFHRHQQSESHQLTVMNIQRYFASFLHKFISVESHPRVTSQISLNHYQVSPPWMQLIDIIRLIWFLAVESSTPLNQDCVSIWVKLCPDWSISYPLYWNLVKYCSELNLVLQLKRANMAQ